MAILRILLTLTLFLSLTGCGLIKNPFDFWSGGDDSPPSATPDRVTEPTAKYSLAIGGVAPGRDELVIYEADGSVRSFGGKELECLADEEIIIIGPRPGCATEAECSGVQMVATDPGVTAVRCKVDGDEMAEVYEVTVPPQNLIQILVAEAGRQLKEEAEIDTSESENTVKLGSISPTGSAIGTVIRNRVKFIDLEDDPALFMAVESEFYLDPPASYYDAVILAPGQFSPTDKADPSYKTFSDAQDRNFLDDDWIVSYDQAVLTAAGIFNGDIADTTGGAFAFRSPSEEQWTAILAAWTSFAFIVPPESGFSDLSFPTFAPIQLLVHPDVWTYEGGRPSFVFARSKSLEDPAVSNTP